METSFFQEPISRIFNDTRVWFISNTSLARFYFKRYFCQGRCLGDSWKTIEQLQPLAPFPTGMCVWMCAFPIYFRPYHFTRPLLCSRCCGCSDSGIGGNGNGKLWRGGGRGALASTKITWKCLSGSKREFAGWLIYSFEGFAGRGRGLKCKKMLTLKIKSCIPITICYWRAKMK